MDAVGGCAAQFVGDRIRNGAILSHPGAPGTSGPPGPLLLCNRHSAWRVGNGGGVVRLLHPARCRNQTASSKTTVQAIQTVDAHGACLMVARPDFGTGHLLPLVWRALLQAPGE